MNKRKVVNDPVYGFITIPSDLIYDLVEHPWFQRLRRIKQLGLTEYVYPGALHTRFHHALGAMHLMHIALLSMIEKGNTVSEEEHDAALAAILLHDIGHGPFSHTLESLIFEGVHHEAISLNLMEQLNDQFNGRLTLAIAIFKGTYHRQWFHQLVSGQLDIDRLDYLQRDCFFTGVTEGAIGADRIIKMLSVSNDQLVVEEKGIYSIENFLNVRRLMYWQVYLHKTCISAEQMLIMIFKRIKHLLSQGTELHLPENLNHLLQARYTTLSADALNSFLALDDYDVWHTVKELQHTTDKTLRTLCMQLIERKLFKVVLSDSPFDESHIRKIKDEIDSSFSYDAIANHAVIGQGVLTNEAYVSGKNNINILTKKGAVIDIAEASELPNIKAISKVVKKYFICYPKNNN